MKSIYTNSQPSTADAGSPGLSREPEVCRFLNVSPRTLRTYRDTGVIPFFRLSRGCIRYDLEAVKQALKNHSA